MRDTTLAGYDADVFELPDVPGAKVIVLAAKDSTELLRFPIDADAAKFLGRKLLGLQVVGAQNGKPAAS